MDFDVFIEKWDNLPNSIAQEMLPVMEEAALTGKGLLTRRVQNEGFGERYIPGRYVKIRKARGFEIRFVNLTFTGQMFRGWSVPSSSNEGLIIRGTVSGIDELTRNKLGWNKDRYENFDLLTDEEKDIIYDNLIQPRLLEIIKQQLFE